jgi:hypothetical protein
MNIKPVLVAACMTSVSLCQASGDYDEIPGGSGAETVANNNSDFDAALADLRKSVDTSLKKYPRRFAIYEFGRSFPAPLLGADGKKYVKQFTADKWSNTLIMIPLAHGRPQTAPTTAVNRTVDPVIWVDTHVADKGRCEAAHIDDIKGYKQPNELVKATDIYDKMNRPDILINANFFDVLPQSGDPSGWKKSLCSATYGPYTDTRLRGQSQGADKANLAQTGNVMLAADAVQFATSDLNTPYEQTALFFVDTPRPSLDGSTEFMAATSKPEPDSGYADATNLSNSLLKDQRNYLAVSGGSLIPTVPHQYTPAPDKATTRTAIAYNPDRDELYIFQGGAYTNEGWSLPQLADFFRALGVKRGAVNLDGGGSSTLFVNNKAFADWYGASNASMGTCVSQYGAYCSLPVQPDHQYRTNPAWLGVRVNLNSTLQ